MNKQQAFTREKLPPSQNHTTEDKQSSVLYLEVDICQTEKRFRQYAKVYNTALKDPEFLSEQYAIHRQGKVEVLESIKSLSIKHTHQSSALAIIKAYHQHLRQIKKAKITGAVEFTMNNQALATLTGMSARSAQRHVNKLLAVGFLKEKVFKGTNASYLLKIDPEFLIARPDEILTDLVIQQHISKYPTSPIPPATYRKFKSLRASFTDIPSGILRTTCLDIEIKQDTFNNKILQQGIVDNCRLQNLPQPEKITVINNVFIKPAGAGQDNKKQEQTDIGQKTAVEQPYQKKVRDIKQKNFPAALLTSIFFFTDLAWNFARSLLYDNRAFNPEQEQAAKHFIAGIFIEYVKNNNPRTLAQCYNEFIVTTQIIHDYTQRKIEWQLARPEYFFDPKFSGGFHRAFKEWLPKHKDKQKKNKEWNSNKKLVAQLYRYYSTEPNFERYRKCTQRLGKLKNKKFLDVFNACIVDQQNFNHQFLNEK